MSSRYRLPRLPSYILALLLCASTLDALAATPATIVAQQPAAQTAQPQPALAAAGTPAPRAPASTNPAPAYPRPPFPGFGEAGDCVLTGQVLDAKGQRAKGVKVYFGNQFLIPRLLNRAEKTWTQGAGPAIATTDDQGRFTFNLMFAGRTDLWAETPNGVGWLPTIDSDARDLTIHLTPKTVEITYIGQILDTDGKTPATDAPIRVFTGNSVTSQPMKLVASTKTDAAGNYRLQFKSPSSDESYLLFLTNPDNRAMAWRLLPYGSINVNLQLKPEALIDGRVVDSRGAPIAGAAIHVTRPRDPDFGQLDASDDAGLFVPRAQTDANGRFTLKGLPQGIRMDALGVGHPEYQRKSLSFIELPDKETPLPDITLADGVTIEGTVRLENRTPVPSATVTWDDPSSMNPQTAITDTDGHYRFTGIRANDQQRLVTVKAGSFDLHDGSPPAPYWESSVYHQGLLKPGDHIALDLIARPSFAVQHAAWKQIRGQERKSDYILAVLDDADPEYMRKATYNDTVGMRDQAGTILWKKSGLNLEGGVNPHLMAVDFQRKTLWVGDKRNNRVLHYAANGDLLSETKDVGTFSMTVDPKTGNAMVITNQDSYISDKLLVISPDGQILHTWSFKGVDIAYSAHDDCFWTAGQTVQKFDREGNLLATADRKFAFFAISLSVNEQDGSVWVAESRQRQVSGSNSQVWIFSPDATTRRNLPLDLDIYSVSVDAPRHAAWIIGSNHLFKTDLDGNLLAEIPFRGQGRGNIEPDTGYQWWTDYKGQVSRLDTDGHLVSHESTTTAKTICIFPK